MSSRVISDVPTERMGRAPWRVVRPARGDQNSGQSGHPILSLGPPEADLQRQLEEARQAGFSEGVAAAHSKAAGEVASTIQRLSDSIAEIVRLRHQVREDAAKDLVQLSLEIASRIMHRELNVDPDAILGLIRAALEKAQSREIHRIRLHPSHEAQVRRAIDQLIPGATVEIVADAALRMGDVFIETPQGHVDASISTQLREIERGLADRLEL